MDDCTLREMTLSGFRSIDYQKAEFGNPIFVVGRNGSGKSNFADAFAFLSEAMASPLQAVVERRGGFSAVSHRRSARGRLANVTLSVALEKPDSDTATAHYYVDLRPRRGYHFEVASESCFVKRNDGQEDSFHRSTGKGSTDWSSTVESLAPAVEPNALALPLVGGDSRFRPVLRFLADMRTYRIEPAALRARCRTRTAAWGCARTAGMPPACCVKSGAGRRRTTGSGFASCSRVSFRERSMSGRRSTATS